MAMGERVALEIVIIGFISGKRREEGIGLSSLIVMASPVVVGPVEREREWDGGRKGNDGKKYQEGKRKGDVDHLGINSDNDKYCAPRGMCRGGYMIWIIYELMNPS